MQGKDGPANSSRLCVKGRYGFDYVQHRHRLTTPLIRQEGVSKHKDFVVDPENWRDVFREATWEEALDLAARSLRTIRDTYGKRALAGFGSAKGTNEEAYLFQKLVRTGFGSNNVDHCTRLCHASSVAALMEGINSGAVSNQVRDVANSEVIVIGANPTVNHPVAATFIKNAAKAGKTLIVADPRRSDLARHAKYYLQFNPDTDVALLNAMLHVIVEEGLVDEAFVATAPPVTTLWPRTSRSSRPRRWRRSAASTRRRFARSRARTRRRRPRSSSGAWASRSTCTAPTTRAA